jgi:hypothetical protein
MECMFTTVALYYWPWPSLEDGKDKSGRFRVAVFLAAVSIHMRPTAGIVWLYLGINLLVNQKSVRTAVLYLLDAAWILYALVSF